MMNRNLPAIMVLIFSLPAQAEELGRIKVLTYNVFGVFVAPNRGARMAKIGAEVAKLDPEVIGFQEAFNRKQRARILSDLEKSGWGKPYEFYRKNWYGPGAWIVSKYPFEQTEGLTYPVNGTPLDSDYYAQKGVAYARIKTPFGPLDFFDTHMIARYSNVYDRRGRLVEDDWSKTDRLLQAEYMARAAALSRGLRSLVAVGDFNSPPVLLEYRLFKALSGLNNVADELPIDRCPASEEDCILEQRIDHIFYRNYAAGQGFFLKPVRLELVLNEKVSTSMGQINLSDHNGLLAEFAVLSGDDPGAKIGIEAKIYRLPEAASAEFTPAMEQALEKGAINPADPDWTRFSAAMLQKLNDLRARRNKVPTTLAKILTAKPGEELTLEKSDLENLEKARKLNSK